MTSDPTKSNWLRRAEEELLARDPVDALNDVEALTAFCERRLNAVLASSPPNTHLDTEKDHT